MAQFFLEGMKMWRHRRTQHTVGETRIRLAKKLSAKLTEMYGKPVEIRPEDLWTQQGAYRSRHWDLARWGCSITKPCEGVYHLNLCSWSTMRNVLKAWKTVEFYNDYRDPSDHYEVMVN